MINKFIWQNYLDSGGIDIVNMFERNLVEEYSLEYPETVRNLHAHYLPCKNLLEAEFAMLTELIEGFGIPYDEFETSEIGLSSLWNLIEEQNSYEINDVDVFIIFIDNLSLFSTVLSMISPDLFVPYFFIYNFNIIQIIANEFDFELPEMPAKSDYRGRYYYYGELCKVLHKFRVDNDLSPFELYAFLYDFAPKYIGGTSCYIITELPEPRSAFFIGASKNDIFLNNTTDTITPWQCNPQTRAGDMIVMYMRYPISSVITIWRSVSIGFNDPFFYYYRISYIGYPEDINKVSISELKNDAILGIKPIVRKNMQGVNGVELLPSEYNHLLDLANSDVQRLESAFNCDDSVYRCEKDVEDNLIKSLLTRLGYSDEDYTQQLYIPLGNRNNLLIPDFVLLPVSKKGYHNAFAIIEAKLKIANEREFREAKIQSRSYSKQLGVKFCIIASKDKIWISSEADDYDKEIFVSTWENLADPDTFAKLYQLIGMK